MCAGEKYRKLLTNLMPFATNKFVTSTWARMSIEPNIFQKIIAIHPRVVYKSVHTHYRYTEGTRAGKHARAITNFSE